MLPKTRLMAIVSNLSLYGVDVPWALMYPTSEASSPASRTASAIARGRAVALRIGRRHVMGVAGHPVADDLGVDRASRASACSSDSEHQDAGALSGHEAVAVGVERPHGFVGSSLRVDMASSSRSRRSSAG